MSNRKWAQTARDELYAGQTVQIRPRGHSMTGRINDGDLVTLAPCSPDNLAAGDIVLARVQGRRFSHLVLHLIHERDGERFLVGSVTGREDGWIGAADIYGKVTEISSSGAESN